MCNGRQAAGLAIEASQPRPRLLMSQGCFRFLGIGRTGMVFILWGLHGRAHAVCLGFPGSLDCAAHAHCTDFSSNRIDCNKFENNCVRNGECNVIVTAAQHMCYITGSSASLVEWIRRGQPDHTPCKDYKQ
eukprot:365271-Chlamydomonas_euryale.AAC.14